MHKLIPFTLIICIGLLCFLLIQGKDKRAGSDTSITIKSSEQINGITNTTTKDSTKQAGVGIVDRHDFSFTNSLAGMRLSPKDKSIWIRFNSNGTFLFQDFNSILGESESLEGTYSLQGKILTLSYTDRPKQSFIFSDKDSRGYTYIWDDNSDYEFIHTDVISLLVN